MIKKKRPFGLRGVPPDSDLARAELGHKDINALSDAIASIGELFNHNDTIVRLDGNGKIVGVNLAGLQEFIAEHICGVRVIVHDGVANKEYFSYRFGCPAAGTADHSDRVAWGRENQWPGSGGARSDLSARFAARNTPAGGSRCVSAAAAGLMPSEKPPAVLVEWQAATPAYVDAREANDCSAGAGQSPQGVNS